MNIAGVAGVAGVVYLEWIDSATQHGWLSREGFDLSPGRCKTVGFLVDENDEVIALALNGATDENTLPFGEIIVIPKVCITKRVKVGDGQL